MKLFTWNVAGISRIVDEVNRKHGGLKQFLDSLDADIVCFQEAKMLEDKVTAAEACPSGWESFWSFSTLRKGHSGVVTYVKGEYRPVNGTATVFKDKELDEEGRCLVTDHDSFAVFNVYVPNAGDGGTRPRLGYKLRFLAALRGAMQSYAAQGKHIILAGDLNIAHGEWDVYESLAKQDPLWHGYSVDEIGWMDSVFGRAGGVTGRAHEPDGGSSGQTPGSSSSSSNNTALPVDDNQPSITPNAGLRLVDSWRALWPVHMSAIRPPSLKAAPGSSTGATSHNTMAPSSDSLASASAASVPNPLTRRFTVWDWRTEARSRNEGTRIDYIGVDARLWGSGFEQPRARLLEMVQSAPVAGATGPISVSGSEAHVAAQASRPRSSSESPSSSSSKDGAVPEAVRTALTNPVLDSYEACGRVPSSVAGLACLVATPHRWSDHSAVMVTLDVPAPPPHPPCASSSAVNKRYKPAGANIMAMFAGLGKTSSGGGKGTAGNGTGVQATAGVGSTAGERGTSGVAAAGSSGSSSASSTPSASNQSSSGAAGSAGHGATGSASAAPVKAAPKPGTMAAFLQKPTAPAPAKGAAISSSAPSSTTGEAASSSAIAPGAGAGPSSNAVASSVTSATSTAEDSEAMQPASKKARLAPSGAVAAGVSGATGSGSGTGAAGGGAGAGKAAGSKKRSTVFG